MSKLKEKYRAFVARHRYAYCCVLTSFSSLLGIVNPVLSTFIAQNILSNFNLSAIITNLVSMAAVKGIRMFLRSNVTKEVQNGSVRAPLVWLQHRISKKLWWLEPMVDNWGWVGLVLTRITGGVSIQASAFFASFVIDTVIALITGLVYYFTQSYVLSILTALIIPSLAVVPWFAAKAMRVRRFSRLRTR